MRAWITLPGLVLAAGCSSPLRREGDEALRHRVSSAVDRELASVAADERRLETTQPPSSVLEELAGRREELDAIGPQLPFRPGTIDPGADLTGGPQEQVSVGLQSAIQTSVRNNLSIQVARLQPAIDEASVVAAEAAFDAVFFSSLDWARIDEPTTVPVIAGTIIGSVANANDQVRFTTGVRKPLTSGGSVFVSTNLDYYNNTTPFLSLFPDPSWSSAINVGFSQPLLRGFGTSVNTASIRLSRNMERRSIQQLRADLLGLVADVERAYWDLASAWQSLAIAEWLVGVGEKVRDVMERRRDFDTKLAQYSDAVATVESRKAIVLSARRRVRAASDALKLLLNDPQITVGSEVLLVPADACVEVPISYNLREAVVTAVSNRPEIQQAILSIDDAAIRQMLADNQRLPLLDVSAQMSYFGLDDGAGDSYGRLFDGNFVDYIVGALFEWPIGNRAAEAGYRQARLQRSQTVIAYQRAVQQVVFDVKNALRDCITSYELIQANRSSRIAAAENLRALLVEEETLAALTPEFLNLKFQRQDRLAIVQRQEIEALVSFNQSVAALYRAMGTGLAMNRIEIEIIDEDPRHGAQGTGH